MALILLALISFAIAVVDGVCISKLASTYSRCTNLNQISDYVNYLDKSLTSGGNVIFPAYETVFHATFNEALEDCNTDGNCNFGDYNCATGDFLKYDYDYGVPDTTNADQLITSNGHVSILYYNTVKK
jgi:hypothetical protein